MFLFVPNGAVMKDWTPAKTGDKFVLPRTLEPLQPHQGDLLVLTGLAHDKARANGDGPGDHARSTSTFLTGVQLNKTSGRDIRAATSIDQIIADEVGRNTELPSLELGCERGKQAGGCDSGYSCAYSSNISWRTPAMPMNKEINPRFVFERLFGDMKHVTSQQDAARQARYRRSVLDAAQDETRSLQRRLGGADRRKLDEYLASVREIERRIAFAEGNGKKKLPPQTDVPSGVSHVYDERVKTMLDLTVLALATDTTRIVSFMYGNGASNRAYPDIGIPDGHHGLTHHKNNPDMIDKVAKINRFHIQQLAYLLAKLKAVTEGESNLLDNSMVLYGSGISDGNRHDHHNLPILLAGSAKGTITPGRHIAFPDQTPLCNLYLSMLERFDISAETFGDSTGPLQHLTAS